MTFRVRKPRTAILIDAENGPIYEPGRGCIDAIGQAVSKSNVLIRMAIGQRQAVTRRHCSMLALLGFALTEPPPVSQRKNASDLYLTARGVELLQVRPRIERVVIVSADRDFDVLHEVLVRNGCEVLRIGRPPTG